MSSVKAFCRIITGACIALTLLLIVSCQSADRGFETLRPGAGSGVIIGTGHRILVSGATRLDSSESTTNDARPDVSFPEGRTSAEAIQASMHPDFEHYRELNAGETRLAEYADSDSMLDLKLYQLDRVNASRRRFGAPPVELDILASRVANRMALEAATDGFSGHWNLRGEKPYHRYAFAGGKDHVSENAASLRSTRNLPTDGASISGYMADAHSRFVAERAPNDGHKQNVINPVHTHVGLGVSIVGNQFRYYEEFIDRYIEYINVPETVAPSEETSITLRPFDDASYVYAVIVYFEPLPGPMTVRDIQAKGSYPDFTSNKHLQLWPWDIRRTDGTNMVTIPLTFSRIGLYYVHVYLYDKPYSTGSASTRGKIQASGIVIRVQ